MVSKSSSLGQTVLPSLPLPQIQSAAWTILEEFPAFGTSTLDGKPRNLQPMIYTQWNLQTLISSRTEGQIRTPAVSTLLRAETEFKLVWSKETWQLHWAPWMGGGGCWADRIWRQNAEMGSSGHVLCSSIRSLPDYRTCHPSLVHCLEVSTLHAHALLDSPSYHMAYSPGLQNQCFSVSRKLHLKLQRSPSPYTPELLKNIEHI